MGCSSVMVVEERRRRRTRPPVLERERVRTGEPWLEDLRRRRRVGERFSSLRLRGLGTGLLSSAFAVLMTIAVAAWWDR